MRIAYGRLHTATAKTSGHLAIYRIIKLRAKCPLCHLEGTGIIATVDTQAKTLYSTSQYFRHITMASKEFLKKIETDLTNQKQKLEAELEGFATRSNRNKDDFATTFPEYGDKEEDNASEVATYSDNLTLEHTLESALRDVKNALKAIKEGTYGTCKYCKQAIDERRLKARPTSSSCISCKKKMLNEI